MLITKEAFALALAVVPTTFAPAFGADYVEFSPEPDVTIFNSWDIDYLGTDGTFQSKPRWAFQNYAQLINVDVVAKGTGVDPTKFERCEGYEDYIESFVFDSPFGPFGAIDPSSLPNTDFTYRTGPGEVKFGEWLSDYGNNTDGIIIMQSGQILYEKYFHDFTPDTRHNMWSVTKSVVGLTASMLVHDGLLDASKTVGEYLPEMTDTALGDATVRQVMDMTTSFQYSEDYTDPQAEVTLEGVAQGTSTRPENYTGPTNIRSFLTMLKEKDPLMDHGAKYEYRTSNSNLLGWIIDAALGGANAGSTKYIQENVWSKLGMDSDAFIGVDQTHFPAWGSLMQATLRDLARFGEMLRNKGVSASGEQVVPEEVVQDIIQGGTTENVDHFQDDPINLMVEGWAYRNMFRVLPGKIVMMQGIWGQWVWIDYEAELIIAKFSTSIDPAWGPYMYESWVAFGSLSQHFQNLETNCSGGKDGSPTDHSTTAPNPASAGHSETYSALIASMIVGWFLTSFYVLN